jgi:hypothetical protein
MIEEDFYATLKLSSGEEIFAKVAASEEDDRTLLIVLNPVIISEIKGRGGTIGYKVEKWLKSTNDDMFIIDLDDIITISESSDIEMISMYQSFTRYSEKRSDNEYKLDRKMGYLANINDAKEILEKIFKSS